MNQRVASSVPSQGTCLGCRPGQLPSRGAERQPHIDVSLPLFLPPFLSLKIKSFPKIQFKRINDLQVDYFN